MALTLRGNGQILSDNYVIDSDGTMGMGTTSPEHALHIKGSYPYIAFEDTDNGATHFSTITGNSDGNIYYDANFNNVGGVNGGHIFRNNGAGISPMRIHSDGYVTTPNQPAFHAYINASNPSHTGTSTKVPLSGTRFNIGNCWDTTNYRFTAPVEGNYVFHVSHNVYYLAVGEWWRTLWYVNGSTWQIGSYQLSQRTGDQTHQSSIVVRLSVNDTLEYYSQASSTYSMSAGVAWTSLMGYLIG